MYVFQVKNLLVDGQLMVSIVPFSSIIVAIYTPDQLSDSTLNHFLKFF